MLHKVEEGAALEFGAEEGMRRDRSWFGPSCHCLYLSSTEQRGIEATHHSVVCHREIAQVRAAFLVRISENAIF